MADMKKGDLLDGASSEWEEDKHPRDDDGKFTSGGRGSVVSNGHINLPAEISKQQFIQKQLNVSEEVANRYLEALYFYTDKMENVKSIRNYQMGNAVKNEAIIAKQEKELEEYIKHASKWNGGETFRGVGLSDEDLARYKVGSVHDMRGTSSWSSSIEVAEDWYAASSVHKGNGVVFHSPTQKHGTSVRHLSIFENEDEVLVSKSSKYIVTKLEKSDNGITHIYLGEI